VYVLVSGGTGFIGRELVKALEARGDRTAVLTRGRAGEKRVTWDARPSEATIDALVREMEKADAVVNLAGAAITDERWTDARVAVLRESRVGATTAIARAIERAKKRPRVLVSGSAVGIYGMRDDDRELDESAPHGDDVLGSIAHEWEASADPARAAGVRVAHPRIGIVLGRGGGALAKMATPFKWFVGGAIGGGRQWLSWIHMQDVVRALIFAIDHGDLAGPFNATSPAPITMNDFARALGAALHRPSAFRVPAFALRLAVGEGISRILLTGQRALPKKLEACGFAFDFPSLDAALADLFTRPRSPLR
jgi:uncharacterized protein (TIGR01777 family)